MMSRSPSVVPLSYLLDLLEHVDGWLDQVPSWENGRWYRRGGWGCRLNLARWWFRDLDEL